MGLQDTFLMCPSASASNGTKAVREKPKSQSLPFTAPAKKCNRPLSKRALINYFWSPRPETSSISGPGRRPITSKRVHHPASDPNVRRFRPHAKADAPGDGEILLERINHASFHDILVVPRQNG